MASQDSDISQQLAEWSKNVKRMVVVGIGNPIRMDDYVGLKIIHDLKGKVSKNVLLIEAETVPENAAQEIADFNPTHILLIDAGVMGLKPGEARLVSFEQLSNFPAFSTHVIPLRVFCEYIADMTKAKVGLLLIEPIGTEFGEGLSTEIAGLASHITQVIADLFKTL